jgi:hypothetical protein
MRARHRARPVRRGLRASLVMRIAVVPLLALISTGCRIDVVTEIAFDVDGAGEVALTVRIDGATLRDLDRLGVDPGLDVEAALDPESGWRASRTIDADGGLVLVHRRDFADGAELGTLLRELSDGLEDDDPSLVLDLDVDARRRGAVTLSGTAGVVAPSTTGVLIDGRALGPSGQELEALVASAVRATLRVTAAGSVVAHDGDRAGERVVEWDLPVGTVRALALETEAPSWWTTVPWVVVPMLVAGAVLASWGMRRGRGDDVDGAADDSDALVSPAE